MFAQLHIRVNPRIHSHSEVFGNYPQCSATPAMFWSTQYFTDVFLSLGTRSRGTCSKIWQFNIEYSSSSRNLARWVHSDSCAATTLLESLRWAFPTHYRLRFCEDISIQERKKIPPYTVNSTQNCFAHAFFLKKKKNSNHQSRLVIHGTFFSF